MGEAVGNPAIGPVRRLPRRIRVRLSLRAAMAIVLVLGSWMGVIVRSARLQREAVAVIRATGGSVTYDIERTNGAANPCRKSWSLIRLLGGKLWGTKWLIDRVGIDYFGSVVAVSVIGPGPLDRCIFDDARMEFIGRLKRLETLQLQGNAVTDAGLAHLRGLSHLRLLMIPDSWISDDDVLELERTYPMLRIIRDDDMAVLRRTPRALRSLDFLRSLSVRVACRLISERAEILASTGKRAQFIATVDVLCGLDADDVTSLLKLADACAECVRAFGKLPPDPSDRDREVWRRLCAERGVRALDDAIKRGFRYEQHVRAERKGFGRHPGLQLPQILKELQAEASAR